jgi:hypothetical protein
MPTGTNMPVTQDWGTVNVGRGGSTTSKPKTARGIDMAKASGALTTEKRYGAGGNASAHSVGIMSAKKVRSSVNVGAVIVTGCIPLRYCFC